jgi:ABC-2 type transport system ATP-binding protein
MIRVTNLTKRYPGRTAVDDLTFSVEPGEIVGFLGPNGAGKTTTMRILTGYLAATGGTVTVAGFDVSEQPVEVRRMIGYLPENCPLYPEMRIDEYLRFRARLKGVPAARRRARLDEVKELCGLTDVGRRIIGQLSKGFRQRVGLAESLIHDPDILILDEPTIGLDPNQIRQVRGLITDLARRHTIVLSTHILPEVEMTCRRVIIINQGRIVASDTTENLMRLKRGGLHVIAEIRGPRDDVSAALGALPAVREVTCSGEEPWLRYDLLCAPDEDVRPAVYDLSSFRGWALRELTREKSSLEDVFVSLTRAEEEVRP